MEKFDDLKVGNTVMIEELVSYGWNTSESFFIPKKVTRVTNTQFVINGDRRFKKDGREIGYNKYSNAYFLGDKYGWRTELVKDQTEEKKSFAEKIKLEVKIRTDIESLKINLNSDLNYEELVDLRNNILNIKETLKTK